MKCPLTGERGCLLGVSFGDLSKGRSGAGDEGTGSVLRAMKRRLAGLVAEILGITDRQMRRFRERYEEHGYDGLMDRRRAAPA
jgi:Helix-turn-helix domain